MSDVYEVDYLDAYNEPAKVMIHNAAKVTTDDGAVFFYTAADQLITAVKRWVFFGRVPEVGA